MWPPDFAEPGWSWADSGHLHNGTFLLHLIARIADPASSVFTRQLWTQPQPQDNSGKSIRRVRTAKAKPFLSQLKDRFVPWVENCEVLPSSLFITWFLPLNPFFVLSDPTTRHPHWQLWWKFSKLYPLHGHGHQGNVDISNQQSGGALFCVGTDRAEDRQIKRKEWLVPAKLKYHT